MLPKTASESVDQRFRFIAHPACYLRITPGTIEAVHGELQRVLSSYPVEKLAASFVVVEPGQHRIRGLEI
jgi:hypothetical protein